MHLGQDYCTNRIHAGRVSTYAALGPRSSRSGEVRGARWDEVDDAAATWTVPPARMKAKLEHRVPLSERAVTVLDEARDISDRSGLVFPSPTGRVLSDSTLSKLLRELGVPYPRVPVQLSGLGCREDGRAARGLRTRLGARQQRPCRGRLPAQRSVRAPPQTDGGLGRLRWAARESKGRRLSAAARRRQFPDYPIRRAVRLRMRSTCARLPNPCCLVPPFDASRLFRQSATARSPCGAPSTVAESIPDLSCGFSRLRGSANAASSRSM